jgi:hypothetical protein
MDKAHPFENYVKGRESTADKYQAGGAARPNWPMRVQETEGAGGAWHGRMSLLSPHRAFFRSPPHGVTAALLARLRWLLQLFWVE